ncbi:hypothetical protein NOCA2540088 [metagenome]|uniref:Uncharacterized protein n=1 Tax=metagenome TaxID=256318 RepID=A0A2P2CA78_9ZZZZ
MDQSSERAFGLGSIEGGAYGDWICDVGGAIETVDLGCQSLAQFLIQVEDDDACAGRGQAPRSCGPEAGRSAGDER